MERTKHMDFAEQPTCHSYFMICSEGQLEDGIGFVAAEGGGFDPDEITNRLGIQPVHTKKLGEPLAPGCGSSTFSEWAACQQIAPAMDAGSQCASIVQTLAPHISTLREIKNEYNVRYYLMVVPHVYSEVAPALDFDSDVIRFCHETETEISVDLYVYEHGQEEADWPV